MGWAIGTGAGGRDIGYAVPSYCDYPSCRRLIDRGVSYACGSFRSDLGCGLYFCEHHLYYAVDADGDSAEFCDRCLYAVQHPDDWQHYKLPHTPKADTLKWVMWKLYHNSWQQWRDEYPKEVAAMQRRLANAKPVTVQRIVKDLSQEEGFTYAYKTTN